MTELSPDFQKLFADAGYRETTLDDLGLPMQKVVTNNRTHDHGRATEETIFLQDETRSRVASINVTKLSDGSPAISWCIFAKEDEEAMVLRDVDHDSTPDEVRRVLQRL